MRILLNGETKDVPEGVNLEGLLKMFSLPRERVAVEQNRQVVRRTEWSSTPVNEEDRIEVIHFVGGG
jgi:thiamine biosynthesis protein ThiS